MKNISTILLYAAIFAALSIFTSCGSQSGRRKAVAEAQAAEDTVSKSVPVPVTEPVAYVFHPVKIEVTKAIDNPHDSLGEGRYPAHTFDVDVFFFDENGKEYQTRIYGQQYLDNKDDSNLKKAKKAYEEIIKTDHDSLMITISADKEMITVDKATVITEQKVGNAILRLDPNPPLWQSYVNIH